MARASKELVQRSWEVICDLCKDRGRQLSQSYGNFDKVVGLGWLLGDAVLGCLLPGPDALAVGRKAAKLAPDFKSEFAAPKRKVGKRKIADGTERIRLYAEAAAQEEELRQAIVTLPFPDAQACRQWEAGSKRHCVKGPKPAVEHTITHQLELQQQRISDLNATQARADAALLVAEGAFLRAEKAEKRSKHAYESAQTRLQKAIACAASTEASLDALELERSQACQRMLDAMRAVVPAEQSFLIAEFNASEAAFDVSNAEDERMRLIAVDAALKRDAKRNALFDKYRASGEESVWEEAVSISY